MMHCAQAGCPAEHKDDRWNHSRAAQRGWFMQRNGDNWCPDHVPEWVSVWRAGKAAESSSAQHT